MDTDVYLIGHHGSRNGTTPELLDAIKPEIAVMGVGDVEREIDWTAWKYGHPNEELINSIADKCTQSRNPIEVPLGDGPKNFSLHTISKAVYATAWDGNIVLEGSSAGVWTYIDPNQIVATTAKVNINTAPKGDLAKLPYIGEVKAGAIITYRNAHGNFTRIDDLDNVTGIGPATIAKIKDLIIL